MLADTPVHLVTERAAKALSDTVTPVGLVAVCSVPDVGLADVIADRVIRGTRPGSIVLLHDGDGYDPSGDRMQTARALSTLIRGLRERGFSFAKLA